MDFFDVIRPLLIGLSAGLLLQLLRERYQWNIEKTAFVTVVAVLPFFFLLSLLDKWLGFESSKIISISAGAVVVVLLIWKLQKNRGEKRL